MSSVAYWYQTEPHRKFGILPVEKRQPVARLGEQRTVDWDQDRAGQTSRRRQTPNPEMKKMKRKWERHHR